MVDCGGELVRCGRKLRRVVPVVSQWVASFYFLIYFLYGFVLIVVDASVVVVVAAYVLDFFYFLFLVIGFDLWVRRERH